MSLMHEEIAKRLPQGGVLACELCDSTLVMREGDAARYLAKGWPECCGRTMRWETEKTKGGGA